MSGDRELKAGAEGEDSGGVPSDQLIAALQMKPPGDRSMTEKGQHLQSQRIIPKHPTGAHPERAAQLVPSSFFSPPFYWLCPDPALWCHKGFAAQLPGKHLPPDPCSGMINS